MSTTVNVELELLAIRERAASDSPALAARDRKFLLEFIDNSQRAFWEQHEALSKANASLARTIAASIVKT